MKSDIIKAAGIIGSGTMGRGIAISASINGYKTVICDISKEILDKAKTYIEDTLKKSVEKKKISGDKMTEALKLLSYTSDFTNLKECDMLIEAASEDMNIKKDIFLKLDSVCNENAILSTNTSSLSVTAISAFAKKHRERVIGLHFFNPANIMKLVEVINGEFTSQEVTDISVEFTKKIGKVPVICKDTPAFIVNRIARPYYGEALKLLAEGAAGFRTVDAVMKSSGFAMGPFELMDLIGIDINFSVTKSVFEAFFYDAKYRPSHIQKKMVDSGLLGRKSGRGFYNYE